MALPPSAPAWPTEILWVDDAEFGLSLKSIKRLGRGAVKGISKATRITTKATGKAIRSATKVSGKLLSTLDRLPVIGRPLSAVYGLAVTGPLELANRIASGARIDKALLGHFRKQLRRVKAVGPYVQMVVSFVPGVGQGVSAAIGAGVALAEGKPLSEVVIAGIRGAIPGGPAARAAFEIGRAALSGKKIDQATVIQAAGGALRLSASQRRVLTQGLLAAGDIARGKRVDEALITRAQRVLPPAARQALSVGMAVAQGKKLQDAVITSVGKEVLARLEGVGDRVVSGSAVLRAGTRVLRSAAQRSGYSIGAGLVAHRSRAIDRKAVRAKLTSGQRRGFDLALAAYRGLAKRRVPAPAPAMKARSRFGYYTALGLRSIPRRRRPAVVRSVVRSTSARAGANVAAKDLPTLVDPAVQGIIQDIDPDFDGLFDISARFQRDQARDFLDDFGDSAIGLR